MEGLATLIVGRGCVERYQARISGPLLDRIDLQIEVPAVSAADLVLPAASEGSAEVRARGGAGDPGRAFRSAQTSARAHQCRLRRKPARRYRRSRFRRTDALAADALGLSARG